MISDRRSRKHIAVCADATRTALQTTTGMLLIAGPRDRRSYRGAADAQWLFERILYPVSQRSADPASLREASCAARDLPYWAVTTAVAQTGGLAVSGVDRRARGAPEPSLLIDGGNVRDQLGDARVDARPPRRARPARASSAIRELRDGAHIMGPPPLADHLRNARDNPQCPGSSAHSLCSVQPSPKHGSAEPPAWSAIALAYVIGNLAGRPT